MTSPCFADRGWVVCTVDDDYNAEVWWEALREGFPELADSLSRSGGAIVSASLFSRLVALPGFFSPMAHARTALIDMGETGMELARDRDFGIFYSEER